MAEGISHEEAEKRGRARGHESASGRPASWDGEARMYDAGEAGITIRERIAMAALQGALASGSNEVNIIDRALRAATLAAEAADALLTELERTDPR